MMYIDPSSQYKYVARPQAAMVPSGSEAQTTTHLSEGTGGSLQLPGAAVASVPQPVNTATHFQAAEHLQNMTINKQIVLSTPAAAVATGPVVLPAGTAVAGATGQVTFTYDGKRMRKAVQRRTVDYNSSVIRFLETRKWFKSPRNQYALQAHEIYNLDVVVPAGYIKNPMNSVTTKFVRTSTNKLRCPIFCVVWTPEGRRLVTGASSGEFTLWNGLTFNFETILQAHDSAVRSMMWSHNDTWLLTGDHAGFVKYWQSNMNNVKMYEAHKDPIRGLSFSPSDSKFASCSDDGLVKVWDFFRCVEERQLKGHGADVKCVDWHPSKGLIVSGSKDSQQPVKLWDPKSGNSITTLHCHKSTVMAAKWNNNGNWLLTGSRDHLIKLYDIRMMKELQTFRGHKKEATAVSWHPVHETLFASGGLDGSVMFWLTGVDEKAGAMENAHEGIVWSLAWHPVGHILCSGSNDHTSKFWTRNRPGDTMHDKYNLDIQTTTEDTEFNEEAGGGSMVPGLAAYDASAIIPGVGLPSTAKSVVLPDSNDSTDDELYGKGMSRRYEQQRKQPKPTVNREQISSSNQGNMRQPQIDVFDRMSQFQPQMRQRFGPSVANNPMQNQFNPAMRSVMAPMHGAVMNFRPQTMFAPNQFPMRFMGQRATGQNFQPRQMNESSRAHGYGPHGNHNAGHEHNSKEGSHNPLPNNLSEREAANHFASFSSRNQGQPQNDLHMNDINRQGNFPDSRATHFGRRNPSSGGEEERIFHRPDMGSPRDGPPRELLPHDMGRARGGPPPNMGYGRDGPPPDIGRPRDGPPPDMGRQRDGPSSDMGRSRDGPPSDMGRSRDGPPPDMRHLRDGPPQDMGRPIDGPPPDMGRPRDGPPPDMGHPRDGPPPDMRRPRDGPPPDMRHLRDGPPPDMGRPRDGPPHDMGRRQRDGLPPEMGRTRDGPPPDVRHSRDGPPQDMGRPRDGPPQHMGHPRDGPPPDMRHPRDGPPPDMGRPRDGPPLDMGRPRDGPPHDMGRRPRDGLPPEMGRTTDGPPPDVRHSRDGPPLDMGRPRDGPPQAMGHPRDGPPPDMRHPRDGPPQDMGRPRDGPPLDMGRPRDGPPLDMGRPRDGPPQDMGHPRDGPPQDMGHPRDGPPQDMGRPRDGPPLDMGRPRDGPPLDMGRPRDGPPQDMGHPRDGPPQDMGHPRDGPPPNMGRPRDGPPQDMGRPRDGPPPGMRHPRDGPPPDMGRPRDGPPPNMGRPRDGPPPDMRHPRDGPPPNMGRARDGPPPDMGRPRDGPPPNMRHPRDGPPLDMGRPRDGPPPDMLRPRDGPPPDMVHPRDGPLKDGPPQEMRHPSDGPPPNMGRPRDGPPPNLGPPRDGPPPNMGSPIVGLPPNVGHTRDHTSRGGHPIDVPPHNMGNPRDGPRRDGPRRDGPAVCPPGEDPPGDSPPRGGPPPAMGRLRDGPPPDVRRPRDGPKRDGPSRDGPPPDVRRSRDGPKRDGPSRDGSSRDGPSRDGPSRDGPSRDGPTRDGPSRDGPTRDGPTRDGPTRDGPTRSSLPRDGPPRSGPPSFLRRSRDDLSGISLLGDGPPGVSLLDDGPPGVSPPRRCSPRDSPTLEGVPGTMERTKIAFKLSGKDGKPKLGKADSKDDQVNSRRREMKKPLEVGSDTRRSKEQETSGPRDRPSPNRTDAGFVRPNVGQPRSREGSPHDRPRDGQDMARPKDAPSPNRSDGGPQFLRPDPGRPRSREGSPHDRHSRDSPSPNRQDMGRGAPPDVTRTRNIPSRGDIDKNRAMDAPHKTPPDVKGGPGKQGILGEAGAFLLGTNPFIQAPGILPMRFFAPGQDSTDKGILPSLMGLLPTPNMPAFPQPLLGDNDRRGRKRSLEGEHDRKTKRVEGNDRKW